MLESVRGYRQDLEREVVELALAVFFLLTATLFTELALIGVREAALIAAPGFVLSAALLFRLWWRQGHQPAKDGRHAPVF